MDDKSAYFKSISKQLKNIFLLLIFLFLFQCEISRISIWCSATTNKINYDSTPTSAQDVNVEILKS